LEAALDAASKYEDIASVKEDVAEDVEVQEEDSDEPQGTVVGVSSNGKKMIAKPDSVYAGYVLCWADGGVMPKELDGRWTNVEKARTAATTYLNSK